MLQREICCAVCPSNTPRVSAAMSAGSCCLAGRILSWDAESAAPGAERARQEAECAGQGTLQQKHYLQGN